MVNTNPKNADAVVLKTLSSNERFFLLKSKTECTRVAFEFVLRELIFDTLPVGNAESANTTAASSY